MSIIAVASFAQRAPRLTCAKQSTAGILTTPVDIAHACWTVGEMLLLCKCFASGPLPVAVLTLHRI